MNRLVSHIEFLLHEHNCVIIPDLGGFVVNSIHSKRNGVSSYLPPTCELVFNRDLTHNDGLLAESYMAAYDLTFERAMWNIDQDVSKLKQVLRDKSYIDLDKLGSFSVTEDNRFTYKPGDFVRPKYFGLDDVNLKPLPQPERIVEPALADNSNENSDATENNKLRSLKRVGASVAAVAAIVTLLFILPVSDTTIGKQMANISYEMEWLKPKEQRVIPNETQTTQPESTVITPSVEVVAESEAVDEIAYYIIMGVFRGEVSASRLIESLKEEGFNSANWLERPERYDVYAASFSNEEDAEAYLKEIHKNYPKHIDAWILERLE